VRPGEGLRVGAGPGMKSTPKVACTSFFDFDISASRSTRSSGNGETPLVVSKPVGVSSPVSALKSCACPESGNPTRPRCSISRQGIGRILDYRYGPHVEEDEEAPHP